MLLSACAVAPKGMADYPVLQGRLDASAHSSRQALVVRAESAHLPRAEAVLYERRADGRWATVMGPVGAVVGRNGFAPEGSKREGDGKTPAGIFRLGTVFGYETSMNTGMAYRQATADDVWVDDPASPDYNRWVRRGATTAKSFENMRRADDLYRCGVVVEYNRDPVVPGHGSAIFVHIWKGEGIATSGCVAMAEDDLLAVIGRLDPALHPVIVMGLKD